MRCYKIGEKLEKVSVKTFKDLDFQYVVILSEEEWTKNKADFDLGIELEIGLSSITSTRAEVNYDSITGRFHVIDRQNLSGKPKDFAFTLDEKGIIFIDDEGLSCELIEKIALTKKLVNPCLERFLYDFLEQIICNDANILSSFDNALDEIEKQIFNGKTENILKNLADIRNSLRDFKIHYLELIDVCQEFEENENHFFKAKNDRYFHLVNQRIQRLYERVITLVEFTVQLREYCQTKTDERQNRTLAFLAVVSAIFMPLTLIVGWYGMNFKYMPELEYRYAYPILFVICIFIVIGSIFIFKKKKIL